ncbi:MAG: hypothetical protein R3C14_16900 [Caldilineaceae bacterium]
MEFLRYVVYFFFWILFSASGFGFFLLLRDSLFKLGVVLRFNPWLVRGIDRWGIFVFGIIWVIFIFWVEGYLRNAVPEQKLWSRIARVLISLTLFGLILLGIQGLFLLLP